MNPSSAPLLSHAVSTYKAFRNLFVAYPLTFFVSVLLLALSAVFGATATAQNPAQNPATWMQDLEPRIGYLQLNQVVLPGTHDSGTASLDKTRGTAENSPIYPIQSGIDHYIHHCCRDNPLFIAVDDAIDAVIDSIIDPELVSHWSEAQDTYIPDQLNQGIRFFDIRPCPYPTPQTYTEIDVCHSLFGEKIQTELQEVQQFSIANKDEIIILSISHEAGDGIMSVPGLNSDLADLIVTTLGTGMLINPPPAYTPSSTLSELWKQNGRIIVLYDHDALTDLGNPYSGLFWDSNNYYPPYPDLDGTYVGSDGRIYWDQNMVMGPASTPENNPENLNELFAVMQNLTCGKHPTPLCPSIGPTPDSGTANAQAGIPVLFALQTQPTPKLDLIGADVFDAVMNDTGVQAAIYTCDITPPFGLCSDLEDDLRQALGLPFAPYPGSLQALDEDANNVILQNITPWMFFIPGSRQNLNIVLADYFESMYTAPGTSGTTVQSNFIDSMLKLNEPPQSTLSIGVPQYGCPTNCFVTSSTPFTISATDSNWGVESINYKYEGPTSFSSKSIPVAFWKFEIAPAADGPYKVFYWATNYAGLWGDTTISAAVTLDNTPPVITIVQPAAVSYLHSATLTLNYRVNDGTGSGVATVTPEMDGNTTLAGNGLASGQPISLLTELPLGTHTFTIAASDNLSNSDTTSVTFTIIVTAQSIMSDVQQFLAAGKITQDGATSLLSKLNSAAKARAAGNCPNAATIYISFISELKAQSGKHVDPTAAAIMIADAQYLIAHCP